jgi:hypothetical protein
LLTTLRIRSSSWPGWQSTDISGASIASTSYTSHITSQWHSIHNIGTC